MDKSLNESIDSRNEEVVNEADHCVSITESE